MLNNKLKTRDYKKNMFTYCLITLKNSVAVKNREVHCISRPMVGASRRSTGAEIKNVRSTEKDRK